VLQAAGEAMPRPDDRQLLQGRRGVLRRTLLWRGEALLEQQVHEVPSARDCLRRQALLHSKAEMLRRELLPARGDLRGHGTGTTGSLLPAAPGAEDPEGQRVLPIQQGCARRRVLPALRSVRHLPGRLMPARHVLRQRQLLRLEMTASLVLISRLLLCGVFAVAGWGKLKDRAGTREAIAAFGGPEGAAGPLAVLIPVVELASAVLLLSAATAIAGAIGALALLVVFSIAIAINLARGRAPECHCFGQLHSAPAGPKTLARNGVLAAMAVFVLVGGGDASAVAWIGKLHDAGLVAFAAGILGIALTAGSALGWASLLRSYGRVLVRVDQLERALAGAGIDIDADTDAGLEVLPPARGLALGAPAPAFSVSEVGGTSVSLEDLLAPRLPLLLVFASPQCGPCSALLPVLAEWQRDHADRLSVAVASDGSREDVRAEAEDLALEHMLVDEGGELYRAFDAGGTPGAVLIAADRTIASRIAAGRDAIEALLESVVDAPGLPVGVAAPAVELVALDGSPVTLDARSDTDTLVLFWNPDCGFCRGMHEDLLAWEARVNGDGPRLVVVSSGDPERTREDRFRSRVVLDPQFSTGDLFGAGGTPSAILLGADGRVASGVAVGAEAVLGLAGVGAERTVAGVA
jgi:thiol-disulfide isomerase/thioredoxin/uncharacterized membrane protein YphA (DoxX/SURF4 family)